MNTETPETNEAIAAILDKDGYLSEDNAPEVLVKLSRTMERERDKYQEQADALVERLGSTQERMIDAERERDEARVLADRLAEAVNTATVLIAAKGRHNTMLAYEGLRKALTAVKGETL